MLTGTNVILALKVAVAAVTVLLVLSLVALARGNYRLHGRINLAFFVLTMTAVLGLELLVRVIDPGMFDYFDANTRQMMRIHLGFSVPSAVLLPVMYFTGRTGRGKLHKLLAIAFVSLWVGTFVTGIFYLPHN